MKGGPTRHSLGCAFEGEASEKGNGKLRLRRGHGEGVVGAPACGVATPTTEKVQHEALLHDAEGLTW